ncbi:ABC-2 type transport system ATP-binding protein [Candidatus Hakubella thermalkaliphila]|uniref:ABC-2 type transport system ATP-binding protein n=1 Tax=Candidatus Hakubella thermalkaliphila TaxID=2754717 RepID=A0A6V8NHM1_9ACTN|nr:ATP-binding cassette domain-containing protein [Candidatus Hakubella thermalkaliphila]GFP19745.1 ABC-2 type transport system ATP-binding protein [Candidatus Hakubella thermalkaliphila]GFP31380.1 ABC-2 type transport system ATP-binding protein [Candidatus Hakubella thermalkaliphila]GFP40474.1 ABC-2 type transport system ATP-binding protein [Candidatus Hakubella thermalkaliphila]GFP43645.1 ABC-2 type transport system ATP-binding protein [Candidatus Hakubella thermalkaliphila]
MPSSVIEINGLVKKYGDRVTVQDVGFSVLEGEIFGLLEPNGAGKTTILSILATLLSPDEGQVTIAGHDLTREADQIKPLIGFVPQELALYSTLSAWDNLVFFGRIYGLKGAGPPRAHRGGADPGGTTRQAGLLEVLKPEAEVVSQCPSGH